MKTSLPEPDSSIRLYYAFTYSPNADSVSQVASTTERMWSVGLGEVLSTLHFPSVYADECSPFRFRRGVGHILFANAQYIQGYNIDI